MAKLKIQRTNSVRTSEVHDSYISPTLINGNHVGGVGGLIGQTIPTIAATVKIGSANAGAGSILAQKGIHKHRVTDGTVKGTCTLVDLATPTVSNTMSIQVDTAELTGGDANAYVSGGASTSAYVTGFTVTGPRPLAVGQVVLGTGATGTVTITNINSASNVTIGYASQTFSNVAAGTFTTSVYASRITNKFVYDFDDNRYRYWFAAPDSDRVRVASA